MKLNTKDLTIKLNKYDEATIFLLLIRSPEPLTPSEITRICYPHKKDSRTEEMGFRRSCEKFSEIKLGFMETEKERPLFIKRKYRGKRHKGFKYEIDINVFALLFWEHYKIYDFFHYSYLPDIKERLDGFFAGNKGHNERKYLPQLIIYPEKRGLEYNFKSAFNAVFVFKLRQPFKHDLSDKDAKELLKELRDKKHKKSKNGITTLFERPLTEKEKKERLRYNKEREKRIQEHERKLNEII